MSATEGCQIEDGVCVTQWHVHEKPDAAEDRFAALVDAWAHAPQKLFEDDYAAFVVWVEAVIVPIVAAAFTQEDSEHG